MLGGFLLNDRRYLMGIQLIQDIFDFAANPARILSHFLGKPGSHQACSFVWKWGILYLLNGHVAMDQYLLIPFLGGWTSIYQLFWCSPGVQGFDTLPCSMEKWWLTNGFWGTILCSAKAILLWRSKLFGISGTLVHFAIDSKRLKYKSIYLAAWDLAIYITISNWFLGFLGPQLHF